MGHEALKVEPDIRSTRPRAPWRYAAVIPFEPRRLVTLPAVRGALYIIATSLLIRVALAAHLGLSDDEAWYWALSRHLEWGYDIHPPLSAWLIRLSTTAFGTSALAVRVPALLCSTLGTLWCLRLSTRLGWAKGADTTALLLVTPPLLLIGGLLSGPDAPLIACWAGIMETSYVLGTPAGARDARAWLRLGALAGLALLSKLTAALACVAAAAWLLASPPARRAFRGPWPYVALALAGAITAPTLVWMWAHGWVGPVFQLFRRHAGAELSARRWLLFWLSQTVAFGPALVYGCFLLLKRGLSSGETRNVRFLALWAAVPGTVFFLQPAFSEFKIHWALYAFLPVIVFFTKLSASGGRRLLIERSVSISTFFSGLGLAFLLLPIGARLGLDRRVDASNDFYGWSRFPGDVARLPDAARGLPLVASRYQTASQAAFALADGNAPPGVAPPVLLFPHDGAGTSDWGGPPNLPASFVYLADARYADDPSALFPGRRCTPLLETTHPRGDAAARVLTFAACVDDVKPKPNYN
jgi:4-amino-4-deoxy-L-arabinose transferase-like glycosyltransferase